MKILMISLDKNILDANSRAAERMKQYGKNDELYIIIPSWEKKSFDLSSSVHVASTGGDKLRQFFWLKKFGHELLKKEKFDLITTQDPFYLGYIGLLLKKKSNVPLQVQVHGDFFWSNYYWWWKRALGRFVVCRADRVRAVGERIKTSLLALGIPQDKIETRPILVDMEAIKNYQPKINLRERYLDYEKIFLVLGRLEPIKNINWLVEVFAEIVKQKKNWLLLIVGQGREQKNLKFKIINLKLQNNIKLEGWTDDPWSYIKTADTVLIPSLSEGYGLVAMEAAAASTPVIMTDVGVANYELKPGSKVKIVPVGDKDSFIKKMLEI